MQIRLLASCLHRSFFVCCIHLTTASLHFHLNAPLLSCNACLQHKVFLRRLGKENSVWWLEGMQEMKLSSENSPLNLTRHRKTRERADNRKN